MDAVFTFTDYSICRKRSTEYVNSAAA